MVKKRKFAKPGGLRDPLPPSAGAHDSDRGIFFYSWTRWHCDTATTLKYFLKQKIDFQSDFIKISFEKVSLFANHDKV